MCVTTNATTPSISIVTQFGFRISRTTWYDCSSTCVGFTSHDAASKSRWICWGCPNSQSDSSKTTTNTTIEIPNPSGRVSISPVTMAAVANQAINYESKEVSKTKGSIPGNFTTTEVKQNLSQENNDDDDDDDEYGSVFAIGDYVYVEEHAWARVNNPEGIATVVKAYVDGDGDQVYDVRYVVGGKANGVLPEYLTRYSFA